MFIQTLTESGLVEPSEVMVMIERCELTQGTAQCVANWVGAMSEPPPEPNTEFDFREPPMTEEGGEEVDDEGGMSAGEDTPNEPSAGMSMMADAAPPGDKEGFSAHCTVSQNSVHLFFW